MIENSDSQFFLDKERFLEEVLDCLPFYIFWKDKNSRYLGCNKNFAMVAGLNCPSEIIGLSDFDLPWVDMAEHFQAYDKKVMESGENEIAIRETQLQSDGLVHWLETNKMPMKNSKGEVIGLLGAFKDITEQVLLEEENIKKEKLDLVAQLAGSIAHDFNNSLSVLSGLLVLSQRRIDNKDFLEKTFKKMSTAINSSKNIANKFISFTKEEQKFLSVMDLEHFFEEHLPLLSTSSGMRIKLNYIDSSPKVLFDEGLFFQLINNIIINAHQAKIEEPNFTIEISKTKLESRKNQEFACIKMTDYAGGIPENILPNIFNPYFTTKDNGTGLGLASCKKILSMQDGMIEVQTNLGVGTTFIIHIPIADQKMEESFIKFTKDVVKGRGTIVLIEDEDGLRSVNVDLINSLGYDVIDFPSVESFIESEMEFEDIQAIVTDFHFEGSNYNGHDLLKFAKNNESSIPVILVSGFIKKIGALEEFDFALPKPLEIQKLSQVLSKFISKPSAVL
ncbi:ATP-binding protein [Halobacteriovorax sp. GB3]|uniref:ATP-binding protein n=1 Tax=Halobacteriovorax sp. GB3 TaxID=2719615 RepID=UPI00235FD34A|nr:ATP-binding protein [Halobacteriovorax sp. GB3]MDD0851817.1 ATP-binding protein [Halobacteriovorax sp. GB3]